jgi:hypothetical protein
MNTFAIGDRVRLRYAATGDPGIVTDLRRGKVHVWWDDLELTTKHAADALLRDNSSESEHQSPGRFKCHSRGTK